MIFLVTPSHGLEILLQSDWQTTEAIAVKDEYVCCIYLVSAEKHIITMNAFTEKRTLHDIPYVWSDINFKGFICA